MPRDILFVREFPPATSILFWADVVVVIISFERNIALNRVGSGFFNNGTCFSIIDQYVVGGLGGRCGGDFWVFVLFYP